MNIQQISYSYVLPAGQVIKVLDTNPTRIRYILRFEHLLSGASAKVQFDPSPQAPGLPMNIGDPGSVFDDFLFPYTGSVYAVSTVNSRVYVIEYTSQDPHIPRSSQAFIHEFVLSGSPPTVYLGADQGRKKFLIFNRPLRVWYRIDGVWKEHFLAPNIHSQLPNFHAQHSTYQHPNEAFYWSFSKEEAYAEWPSTWAGTVIQTVFWR